MRRRDVNDDEHTVHVHGSKNAWRDRVALVDDWAWPFVAGAAKAKLPDSLIFVDELGAAPTRDSAMRSHRRALKALGLDSRYTLHDSRHSFAVRWMREGLDPQLIANNLGHKDATGTADLRQVPSYRCGFPSCKGREVTMEMSQAVTEVDTGGNESAKVQDSHQLYL